MNPVKTILSLIGAFGLAAGAQAVEVRLDWNANSESDLSHYNVYRSTSSGSTGSKIGQASDSDWTDSSVSAGTTYYYRVSAVDNAGNESSKSSQVSAVIPAEPTDPPPPPPGDGAFIEAGGRIVIEAENFTGSRQNGDATNWRTASGTSGYVGGGYVDTPDNGIANASWSGAAELSYDLAIQTGGSYHVWVRRNSPDGAGNSAYVGADGAQAGADLDNGGGDGWQWVEHGATINLSAGNHQLQLRRREDGYRVDRILLTTDGGYTPSGNGPAESDRGGVSEPPPPPPSGDLIANPSAASGKAYTLASLAVGSELYIDRPYQVSDLPSDWVGAEQIRTANDDKNSQGAGFLTFDLTSDAEVYVAFDNRASVLPTWLQSWTFTGTSIPTGDVPFEVYRKSFAAGGVSLGGNTDGGSSPGSMYWVFAIGGGTTTPPPSDFALKVNFQPASAPTVSGYEVDSGAAFGNRGNGYSYGWDQTVNETRDRNVSSDQRFDTLNHMQKTSGRSWEVAVPDGIYEVRIVAGDPAYTNQVNSFDLEGVTVADPDGQDNFDDETTIVEVTDGRLTLKAASGASNAKVCFIEITSTGTAN